MQKILAILVPLIASAYSAKILAVFPTSSYSHQIVYQPIWRELSLRGHQVTVLTTDPLDDPTLMNLTEISWKESYVEWKKLTKTMNEPKGVFELMAEFQKTIVKILDGQLSHPEVTKLINNEKEHFDLVIVEWLMSAMGVFAERFQCPLVGISSFGTVISGHDAVGNPSHPALNPDFMLPFQTDLSLMQRIISTLYSVWSRYNYRYGMRPAIEAVIRKHFGEDIPPVEVIEKNVSMVLLNVNSVFYTVRPNVPAIKELGGIGIHIKPRKPLPQDLQKYLDDSKQGVIYFSLGSNIESSKLTPEKLEVIKETLGELPYNILWKYEDEKMPGKPHNVKISSWLPQQDVLGHPNIKLFITQGGLQSMEEALYNRIPCLGIPFFTEQYFNLDGARRHGFVKMIEFKTLTKETFKETILEMISNPIYKIKANEVADLVLDEPMKAVDKAIWWIEYIIRHKGARHLRSPAVDMPWYQYLLLDVFAILFSILFIVIFILYKLIKLIIFKTKFCLCRKIKAQ